MHLLKKPNYLYISIAVSNKMSSAEILSLFKSKVSRHYDTVNYIVFLDEIDVYNNELSTKGGCNKWEHHKRIFRDIELFFECNGDDVNVISLPEDMRTFTSINPVSKNITVLLHVSYNSMRLKGTKSNHLKLEMKVVSYLVRKYILTILKNCWLVQEWFYPFLF